MDLDGYATECHARTRQDCTDYWKLFCVIHTTGTEEGFCQILLNWYERSAPSDKHKNKYVKRALKSVKRATVCLLFVILQ